MTIQRQYVLPNCSLILEGLGTEPASNVLSILANAEFRIAGLDQRLSGGSDFFRAVAATVSAYCQGLLSGLEHTQHMSSQQSLVTLESGAGQYHRLIFTPTETEDSLDWLEPGNVREFQLSTVQLFDMAEAIDQLVADGQTLPEFTLGLSPLSRRYVSPQEPLTQRLLPPLLGVGSVAIAALGLFMLPVPELTDSATSGSSGIEAPAAEDTVGSSDPEDPEDTPAAGSDAPPEVVPSPSILDDAELEALQQQLQQQLASEFESAEELTEPVSYDVSVAENGDVLGYRPLGETAIDAVENTPLPAVTYIPVGDATVEPVANFRVTFTADGQVEVIDDSDSSSQAPVHHRHPVADTPRVDVLAASNGDSDTKAAPWDGQS